MEVCALTEHDDVIVLKDEEGQEHKFAVLDILTVNAQEYAILVPLGAEDTAEQGETEQEAVIFRLVPGGESEERALLVVEDDEEWQAVAEAWEDSNSDLWDGEETEQ
jgi:uncharacterized protein YrzB (UPF0473 family)